MPKLIFPVGETYENAGADTSVSEGSQVPANGSANVKGSYTQLIASTAHPGAGLMLILGGSNASPRSFLVDIAVGAAASEQIILPNIFYASQQDSTLHYGYIPIAIPKGSRISARSQDANGGNYVRANAIVIAGESGYPQSGVAYGANTGASSGTTVNTSASANTKGSWTEITSGTSRAHFWGLICARALSSSQYLLDIGIGGSGSEQIIVPNLNIRDSSSGDATMWSIPFRIPSGTRIAARAAAANGSSGVSVSLVLI